MKSERKEAMERVCENLVAWGKAGNFVENMEDMASLFDELQPIALDAQTAIALPDDAREEVETRDKTIAALNESRCVANPPSGGCEWAKRDTEYKERIAELEADLKSERVNIVIVQGQRDDATRKFDEEKEAHDALRAKTDDLIDDLMEEQEEHAKTRASTTRPMDILRTVSRNKGAKIDGLKAQLATAKSEGFREGLEAAAKHLEGRIEQNKEILKSIWPEGPYHLQGTASEIRTLKPEQVSLCDGCKKAPCQYANIGGAVDKCTMIEPGDPPDGVPLFKDKSKEPEPQAPDGQPSKKDFETCKGVLEWIFPTATTDAIVVQDRKDRLVAVMQEVDSLSCALYPPAPLPEEEETRTCATCGYSDPNNAVLQCIGCRKDGRVNWRKREERGEEEGE